MERKCLDCALVFEPVNKDDSICCPACHSKKTKKVFYFTNEIQRDVDRIEYILSRDIFLEENKNDPLVKSALTEVLICLRDLVDKIKIISKKDETIKEITFTQDVIIPSEIISKRNRNKYTDDIRGLIIAMRDALCHQDLPHSFVVQEEARLPYRALYGIDSILVGDIELSSDYEDDVCFFIGNMKIYLNRHIIKYFDEAKKRLSGLIINDKKKRHILAKLQNEAKLK